ncbi:MAG: tetratricopeptide repeat protein [Polyangiales bacterium]
MPGPTREELPEPARRWPQLAPALAAVMVLCLSPSLSHAQDEGSESQQGGEASSEPEGSEPEGDGAEAAEDGADEGAGAGEQDARTHFRLGRVNYEAGRFAEAAREFEQAYELSGRGELLYNIFLARRDAGHIGEAIEALDQYLELVEDIDNRSALEARLRTMRRLRDQRGDEGESDEGERNEGEGATGAGDDPSAEHDEQTGDRGASEPVPPPAPRTEDASPSALPWTVAGVGGALLVGGVVTGVLALKKESDLESRCERVAEDTYACEPGFEDDKSKGAALATATDVLVASGLAFVGAGVALFFLLDDGDASERASASVGCDGHGCAGSVRVSF